MSDAEPTTLVEAFMQVGRATDKMLNNAADHPVAFMMIAFHRDDAGRAVGVVYTNRKQHETVSMMIDALAGFQQGRAREACRHNETVGHA